MGSYSSHKGSFKNPILIPNELSAFRAVSTDSRQQQKTMKEPDIQILTNISFLEFRPVDISWEGREKCLWDFFGYKINL